MGTGRGTLRSCVENEEGSLRNCGENREGATEELRWEQAGVYCGSLVLVHMSLEVRGRD